MALLQHTHQRLIEGLVTHQATHEECGSGHFSCGVAGLGLLAFDRLKNDIRNDLRGVAGRACVIFFVSTLDGDGKRLIRPTF